MMEDLSSSQRMTELAEFQYEFARALVNPFATQRQQYGAGFAVYQNTVSKGLVDALRANYPTVEQLVGSEWFDSAALQYAREHLPEQPALALYGGEFAACVDAPARAHGLNYLSSVAELDRLWSETHFGVDAATLSAADLQTITAEQLPALRLQWHPAMRVTWLPHSAPSIWQHNRPPATPPESFSIDDVEEGLLLTRPHGAVVALSISRAEYDFLQHQRDGMTLGEAAAAVLEQHEDADIAAVLARMIQAGAFTSSIN
jgi:hypothetical protein